MLELRLRTVEQHVGSCWRKLGVETCTAARRDDLASKFRFGLIRIRSCTDMRGKSDHIAHLTQKCGD